MSEDRIVAQQSITSPRIITNVLPSHRDLSSSSSSSSSSSGQKKLKFVRLVKKLRVCCQWVRVLSFEMAGPTRSSLFTSNSPRQPAHRPAEQLSRIALNFFGLRNVALNGLAHFEPQPNFKLAVTNQPITVVCFPASSTSSLSLSQHQHQHQHQQRTRQDAMMGGHVVTEYSVEGKLYDNEYDTRHFYVYEKSNARPELPGYSKEHQRIYVSNCDIQRQTPLKSAIPNDSNTNISMLGELQQQRYFAANENCFKSTHARPGVSSHSSPSSSLLDTIMSSLPFAATGAPARGMKERDLASV